MNKALEAEVEDVLSIFKAAQAQDAASVLWFRSNPDVAKLILAWSKVEVQLTGNSKKLPSKIVERWGWLWSNYTFSYGDWLALAGIADNRHGVKLISRIILLRMVFPDNSTPGWLERYITLSALHATSSLTAKKTPKEQPKSTGIAPELEDDD